MLTLTQAQENYVTTKAVVLTKIRAGELQASRPYEGRGRQGAWSIPESEMNKHFTRRAVPKPVKNYHLPEAVDKHQAGISDDYLSLKQAAEQIGCSINGLYVRLVKYQSSYDIKRGTPPTAKWYIHKKEISRLQLEMEPRPTEKAGKAPVTLPQGSKNTHITLKELCAIVGRSEPTLRTHVLKGNIPGTKVQLGPKRWSWFFNREDVPAIQKFADGLQSYAGRPAGRPRGRSQKMVVEPVVFAPYQPYQPREASPSMDSNDLLTAKLLELADMVRDNPMVKVTKLNVEFSFNG